MVSVGFSSAGLVSTGLVGVSISDGLISEGLSSTGLVGVSGSAGLVSAGFSSSTGAGVTGAGVGIGMIGVTLGTIGITGAIGNVGTVGIAGDVGIVLVLSVLGLRLASISASRRASSSCSLDVFSGAVIELLPVEAGLLEEAALLIMSRTCVIGAIELAPSSREFATREESIGVAPSRLLE